MSKGLAKDLLGDDPCGWIRSQNWEPARVLDMLVALADEADWTEDNRVDACHDIDDPIHKRLNFIFLYQFFSQARPDLVSAKTRRVHVHCAEQKHSFESKDAHMISLSLTAEGLVVAERWRSHRQELLRIAEVDGVKQNVVTAVRAVDENVAKIGHKWYYPVALIGSLYAFYKWLG